MIRPRALRSVPAATHRDDFGLSHRAYVQALRVGNDEAFQEPRGGSRERPGLNSWLTACVGRIRGVRAR